MYCQDSELVYIERIYGVATVAGVEILQQRQVKDSVPDLQWISERVEGHVFLLTIAQKQESKSKIAYCNGLLGDIERDRDNWDAAETLYWQSLTVRTAAF
ncbi:MAG: hypothetical protein V7K21_13820 [Nostoc sp.]|uniref:hypothetical protein n=1 Tax=Nostoc sp. TaxID=1180 RepID=UPI002FF504A9